MTREPPRGPSGCVFWAMVEAGGGVGRPWGRFGPLGVFVLTVPRRYFCCGSLLFLLSVFILWFGCYVGDMFCKFWVAGWPPVWEGAVHSVCHRCLSWTVVDLCV